MGEQPTSSIGDPVATSPLAKRTQLRAPDDAITMTGRPFQGKLVLRGAANLLAPLVESILGALPENGHLSSTTDKMIMATAPDEWLIVTDANPEALARQLSKRLSRHHHQIVTVSDYYATIRVEGRMARRLLQKLTTRDLHARYFTVGMGGGILIGHANPWIALISDDNGHAVFDLFIRWSHADYLWCLLANAGGDWDLPRQAPRHGEQLVI